MNDKISFPDLVTLLAAKLNVSKKDAESFLKEFFTLATEVVATGEELCIDGLGKFKPLWVEARTGVNVQTGEPVEIPGHYRISFLPDKVLRDAVNAPFSSFSVEVLNDHVALEEMLPPEENPVAEESIKTPQEEPVEVLSEVEQPIAKDTACEEHIDVEPVEEIKKSPEKELPEKLIYSDTSPFPEDEEENSAEEEDDENEEDEYKPRLRSSRRYFWWGVLSTVGVIILLLCAGGLFIYHSDKSFKWEVGEYTLSITSKELSEVTPVIDKTVVVETMDTLPVVVEPDTLLVDTTKTTPIVKPDTTVVSASVVKPEPKVESKPLVTNKKIPKKETIRQGVFLTTLSLRHYGHKAFWVYIYEENKSIIKNPDQIPIGTEVVIPEASKYKIDANSRASIDRAKALARKIKGK